MRVSRHFTPRFPVCTFIMAGVFRKSLLTSAKLIGRQLLTTNAQCASRISLPVTLSSRSLWNFSSLNLSRALAGPGPKTHTCGCCKLHTEVDKEISKFLDKEIEYEESSAKSKAGLPKIQGFDVSGDDSVVTLTRKQGNESIKVTFNVNGSADSDQMSQVGESSQEEEVQMISRPPFTVELNKGSGEILAFQCTFSSLDDLEQDDKGAQETESIVDQFDIQEVTIHRGEWKETVYSLPAETMDGNLYDLLMDMLDERGINDDFVNDLVEFSTAYEHGKYVGFLKTLKSFVEKN